MAIGDKIFIADKFTLDQVKDKVDTNLDAKVSTRATQASVDTKASQTSVNTIITNVGSNADAASASGSVHAKLKDIKNTITSGGMDILDYYFASNNVITQNNTNVSISSETSTIVEESFKKIRGIYILNMNGTVRVYATGSRTKGSGACQYRIFKNGVLIIPATDVNNVNSIVISHDINASMGDYIELQAGTNASTTITFDHVSVRGTKGTKTEEVIIS